MATRVLAVDADDPDAAAIAEAAAVLARGGLVAFPTETVYGLGADARDPQAIARLFDAKGRPPTDPVILHVADVRQLPAIVSHVPRQVPALARAFWPGPLTLILPRHASVPAAVSAGLPTVGVRVPSHPVAQHLLRRAGLPVAAPSANRFSAPSPTTAAHVVDDLDGRIDLILDGGPTPIGVESTVLDLTVTPPVIRRPGGVSLRDIRRILPAAMSAAAFATPAAPQRAPGQLLRHYAPRAALTLYLGEANRVVSRMAADARTATARGSRVGILSPGEDLAALAPRLAPAAAAGRIVTARYGSRKHPDEAARDLFGALRDLDTADVDLIFASAPTPDGIGDAIIDRLSRAADGRVIYVQE